jgi:UDPglucose 6-dehydrogenase
VITKNTDQDILLVGTGYVGLITALGLAKLGNTIACYDINPERVAQLQNGTPPFFEPEVTELLAACTAAQQLQFFDSLPAAYKGQRYIFVAVPTPQDANGKTDLTALRNAVTATAALVTTPTLMIIKSTVPVGIFDELEKLPGVAEKAITFVSCPEFLAEGTAVHDFFHPTRTIVGAKSVQVAEEVAGLFQDLGGKNIITDAKTAQMIKYGANSFLATRVAFINDIAEICEKVDVNVQDVAQALVMDLRVGGTYLMPSIGFGGPCLPKDIAALIESSERVNVPVPLLRGAREHNVHHLQHIIDTISSCLGDGKVVAVFGLSFKPNTDDVRNAFSLKIIQALLDRGATVRATDPHAIPAAKQVLTHEHLTYVDDPLANGAGSDLQLFLTPWETLRSIDLHELAKTVRVKNIYDGMHVLQPNAAREAGFMYRGVGVVSAAQTPPFLITSNPAK